MPHNASSNRLRKRPNLMNEYHRAGLPKVSVPKTRASTHNLDDRGGSSHTASRRNLDSGGGARVPRVSGRNLHNVDSGGGRRNQSLYTTARNLGKPVDNAIKSGASQISVASPHSRQGIKNNADRMNYDPKSGGKEWANHKYIDKVKTKSGKWRYIYDPKTGNVTKKREQGEYNLDVAARKAGQRNTGRPDSMRGLSGAINNAGRAASGAVRSAQKAGSDFCKAVQGAWASTPLSKLFG